MKRNLPASSPRAPDASCAAALTNMRSPRWIRRIAYEAEVCERTVLRYFDDEEIRPSSRERIERVLTALSDPGEEVRK